MTETKIQKEIEDIAFDNWKRFLTELKKEEILKILLDSGRRFFPKDVVSVHYHDNEEVWICNKCQHENLKLVFYRGGSCPKCGE